MVKKLSYFIHLNLMEFNFQLLWKIYIYIILLLQVPHTYTIKLLYSKGWVILYNVRLQENMIFSLVWDQHGVHFFMYTHLKVCILCFIYRIWLFYVYKLDVLFTHVLCIPGGVYVLLNNVFWKYIILQTYNKNRHLQGLRNFGHYSLMFILRYLLEHLYTFYGGPWPIIRFYTEHFLVYCFVLPFFDYSLDWSPTFIAWYPLHRIENLTYILF